MTIESHLFQQARESVEVQVAGSAVAVVLEVPEILMEQRFDGLGPDSGHFCGDIYRWFLSTSEIRRRQRTQACALLCAQGQICVAKGDIDIQHHVSWRSQLRFSAMLDHDGARTTDSQHVNLPSSLTIVQFGSD